MEDNKKLFRRLTIRNAMAYLATKRPEKYRIWYSKDRKLILDEQRLIGGYDGMYRDWICFCELNSTIDELNGE